MNLIEYFYLKEETNRDTKKAIYDAIGLLQGTYGLVIFHQENHDCAYVIKGSPLLISETDGELLQQVNYVDFKIIQTNIMK